MLKLFNTMVREKQEFISLKKNKATIYTCGPTVYDYAHIGNLRSYIFEDILIRTLLYNGFEVKHVINITDIGHLTSDADVGEDKMMKALKREGLEPSVESMKILADKYTQAFKKDIEQLNVFQIKDKKYQIIWAKATDHVKEMIKLVKVLLKKGYAYETKQAIYFDVTKFENYTKLSKQELAEKLVAVRQDVQEDPDKKQPADFALWFKKVGKHANDLMTWKEKKLGEGFPGWHLECSAMAMKYLGETLDIHCGGIDHINVHHTNEIAQSEAATGKPFANFWLHNEFVNLKMDPFGGNIFTNNSFYCPKCKSEVIVKDNKGFVKDKDKNGDMVLSVICEKCKAPFPANIKMSKSIGTFFSLSNLVVRGYDPLALRYLYLGTHYRKSINFSLEALDAAQNALEKMYKEIRSFDKPDDRGCSDYKLRFEEIINDDLNTAQGLALSWDLINDKQCKSTNKITDLFDFDQVLGLNLKEKFEQEIKPSIEVLKLLHARQQARENKDWEQSDKLRDEMLAIGWAVEDTKDGPKLVYIMSNDKA